MNKRSVCLLVCLLFLLKTVVCAQIPGTEQLKGMKWRMIGPFRAGRTVGATGVPGQPNVFYIGVNNGGVWKTDDYGRIIDDRHFASSISAVQLTSTFPFIQAAVGQRSWCRASAFSATSRVPAGMRIL